MKRSEVLRMVSMIIRTSGSVAVDNPLDEAGIAENILEFFKDIDLPKR